MPFTSPRSRRAERRNARRTYAPRLESLEDRTMPAAILSTGIGAFDPATATWDLRTTATPGSPAVAPFQFGPAGSLPVVGDWLGNGTEGLGVFDPKTATWYLRSTLSPGAADVGQFQFGPAGALPVVGDWLHTGKTGIGVFDPSTANWFLRSTAGPGAPDVAQFQFGPAGALPLVGDWLGNGTEGIGVFDPTSATFFLRDSLSGGDPDAGTFQFGPANSIPIVGDWLGTGKTGIGVFDPSSATFFLRDTLSNGLPNVGQFVFGALGSLPIAGALSGLPSVGDIIGDLPGPTTTGQQVLNLIVKPLDINLLGVEVKTEQIQATVTAQPGNGALLGNVLNTVSNLVNLKGVNGALNNVLDSVVTLLNSASLSVNVNTGGTLGDATVATIPVLDAFIAPVHLNLLGAVVDTSPIHLTIMAHSGPGLILGNVVADLANLFNPPLPSQLDLPTINSKLADLLAQLNAQIPDIPSAPIGTAQPGTGAERVLSLDVPPINVNLLGLVLKTSEIRVNADAVTGNGDLLGNVLTTLLNTLGATPQSLTDLSNNINALLAKVVGVLNVSSLLLPANITSTLSTVLQTLALPNLINQTGTPASTPVLNLNIASTDGTTPPVNINLLGLVITTSNIQVQLNAQTGDGQILGNLVYNIANILNPGGTLGVLSLLGDLGL